MGDTQLTLTRTGERAPCRAPTRSTFDRVTIAWQHSTPWAQCSLLGACAMSVVLAAWRSTIAVAVCGVLLAVAAFVDLRERRIPNRLLAAAWIATFVGVAVAADLAVLWSALVGTATAGGSVLMVRLSRGVGMGDVKMAGVIGTSIGATTTRWFAPPAAIAITAFAAAMYGTIARKQRVVLGPALWFGWAAALALETVGWS